VSASLISDVTDAVLDEVTWQSRSLDAVYPLVWMDAIVVEVRESGRVINKAIHLVSDKKDYSYNPVNERRVGSK
jgi:putative transposase